MTKVFCLSVKFSERDQDIIMEIKHERCRSQISLIIIGI